VTGPDEARPGPAAGRVVVRASRVRPGATRHASSLHEVREQTEIGDLLLRSLIRAQLLAAVRVLIVVVALFAGIPAVFGLAPGVARYRLAGVPVAWIVLGGAMYPVLWLAGRIFVRAAERHEREFIDVVQRP
jgi:hypothetical protein